MELIISIGILTAVVCVADVGLAIQGNWAKIVRVTLGAASYVAILGSVLKLTGRFGAPAGRLPLWAFLVAGLCAGLVAGLAGSEAALSLALASVVVTPVLLAAVHWVIVQRWAWIRRRLASRPGPGR